MDMEEAIGGSSMAGLVITAALIETLRRKDLLDRNDLQDIYEAALLKLEQRRTSSPPLHAHFEAARRIVEQALLPIPSRDG